MALQKQSLNIPLALGLNLKTDPWQINPGQFLTLSNVVFTQDKLLAKRSGFPALTVLPSNSGVNTLSTFKGDLVGLGQNLLSYSGGVWVPKGRMQPISLSTVSAARSSYNQTSPDVSVGTAGLSCVVWEEPVSGTLVGHYNIINNVSGELIQPSTTLPNGARCPRAFFLNGYFIVTFIGVVGSTPELQYIAIPQVNPTLSPSVVTLSTQVASSTAAYDAFLSSSDNRLYLCWAGSDIGGAIRYCFVDQTLAQHVTFALPGHTASLLSIFVDPAGPYAWITGYSSPNSFAFCLTSNLSITSVPYTVLSSSYSVNALTSTSSSGVLRAFFQVNNVYPGGSVRSDYIASVTCTQSATVGTPSVVARGVGLASKPATYNSIVYLLVAYGSPSDLNSGYEPSYFLIDSLGNVISRLAGSNAGGYAASQVLSNASLSSGVLSLAYLLKDFLAGLNKGLQNAPGSAQAAVYTQTGVNLGSFNLAPQQLITSEIAGVLNTTGGMLWQYDGTSPSENNFHLFPEDINATWSTSGGSIAAQPDGATNDNAYFYQVTYECTDSQGNLSRSAPSVPVAVTTTGSGSSGSITLVIPTLRLTYKSNVRIVIYRWSVAQQNYYQVTSITNPVANNSAVDSVTYVDTLADNFILGNNIIYTTGGVVEDIAPPASTTQALFANRLFLVDAEDQNLLWYSKQVIENTPVEMSDLFTIYVPPTGPQGTTGTITALSAMDDKLIIFKNSTIFYITGQGPDNTGANNDFSEAVFVTSAVGCSNQRSIVTTPNGLMFQTGQGIWMLGRDLAVTYIGAPVEAYNSYSVVSAIAVPNTTQVRFSLSNGVKLMYDYFYGKWGTFDGVGTVSSTSYLSREASLNAYGQVWHETPGVYIDGQNPVNMSLTTGWLNMAGLQGFERAYFMYLIANYKSPHNLSITVAYDYNSSKIDSYAITPDNFSGVWGSDYAWGTSSPWGGNGTLEQWRLFFRTQKCQALQISLTEQYDPSYGVNPGAGLTLSGINVVVGAKSTYPRLKASRQVG